MEHKTSKQLFHYWDLVRNGRRAPERMEIEPGQIAGALPQTFVLDCAGTTRFIFRLAGTRICTQFSQELRGINLLDFWNEHDREALETLLINVVEECAAASVLFESVREDGRTLKSEMLLLPLLHASRKVNRIIGSISAAENPYWLGTAPFSSHKILTLDLHWPDGAPKVVANEQTLRGGVPQPIAVAIDARRKFRVYDGGRSGASDGK